MQNRCLAGTVEAEKDLRSVRPMAVHNSRAALSLHLLGPSEPEISTRIMKTHILEAKENMANLLTIVAADKPVSCKKTTCMTASIATCQKEVQLCSAQKNPRMSEQTYCTFLGRWGQGQPFIPA